MEWVPFGAAKRFFFAHGFWGVSISRFRMHLKALEYAFGLTFWSDDSIQAGDHWDDSILAEINRANVFLLLVSPSTIASRYINEPLAKLN